MDHRLAALLLSPFQEPGYCNWTAWDKNPNLSLGLRGAPWLTVPSEAPGGNRKVLWTYMNFDYSCLLYYFCLDKRLLRVLVTLQLFFFLNIMYFSLVSSCEKLSSYVLWFMEYRQDNKLWQQKVGITRPKKCLIRPHKESLIRERKPHSPSNSRHALTQFAHRNSDIATEFF